MKSYSMLVTMKVTMLILLAGSALGSGPTGTTFTYQGQLKDGGSPANGLYDLEFSLYDGDDGWAALVAGPVVAEDIQVTDGLFTFELDFGEHFNGSERWLAIGVRPGESAGAFTPLSGRQRLAATPYAQHAVKAALATTATTVPWSAITDVPNEILDAPWGFAGPIQTWGSNATTLYFDPIGNFVDIAAGASHALAMTSGGTVVGWGNNQSGQIGILPDTYVAISAGGSHSLVIRHDGRVFGYGDNSSGQIENQLGAFLAVSAGNLHSLGIRTNGTLAGWGSNLEGQINVPSGTFTAIAAGGFHSLAIRSDGTLTAWGNNAHGQLDVPAGTFVAIAAGFIHSLAIRSDGTLVAWGNNDWGQCNVPSGTYTRIAAGHYHNLAIRTNGNMAAWGRNDFGQAVARPGHFSRIAASSANSIAIQTQYVASSQLAVGNMNVSGSLGVGTNSPASRLSVSGDVDISGSRLHVSMFGNVGVGVIGAHELFAVQGGMLLDAANLANGAPESGQAYRGLRLGGMNSGEGISSNRTGGSPNNSGLDFYTARAARLSITNTGNVGIGTQSPSQRLHVVGNICATGTIGTCSDARFKEHVEPVAGALEKVEQLRGVHFDWKREEFPDHEFAEARQLGFIAQEVEKVLPQVVSRGEDGYLSVDYGRMTPLLVEAMKELRMDNQRLHTEKDRQLALRDAELDTLRAEIQELKAQFLLFTAEKGASK